MKKLMVLLITISLLIAGDGVNDFKYDAGSTIDSTDRIHFLDASKIGTIGAMGKEYVTYESLYDKVYADMIANHVDVTEYFAYAHIDSAGADTTSIATPGTWYQMQGTIEHHLLGFTKTDNGLQYDGIDSLQFKSLISLSVKSSRARTIVTIGTSINGKSPHTVMPVYCYYSNQWYSMTCPDAWWIHSGEKVRVVITANKTTNVTAGSGGITFEPSGKFTSN